MGNIAKLIQMDINIELTIGGPTASECNFNIKRNSIAMFNSLELQAMNETSNLFDGCESLDIELPSINDHFIRYSESM